MRSRMVGDLTPMPDDDTEAITGGIGMKSARNSIGAAVLVSLVFQLSVASTGSTT